MGAGGETTRFCHRAPPSQAIGLRLPKAAAPGSCVKRFAIMHSAVMHHASCRHVRFISCQRHRAPPSQVIGRRSLSAGAPHRVHA